MRSDLERCHLFRCSIEFHGLCLRGTARLLHAFVNLLKEGVICVRLIKVEHMRDFLYRDLVFFVILDFCLDLKVAPANTGDQKGRLGQLDHRRFECRMQVVSHALDILACLLGFSICERHVHCPSVRVFGLGL